MGAHDWQALTRLTAGEDFEIERVRLIASDIAIEGRFEPPPLAGLTAEDQVFVSAFVRCHGSIKQMEKYFGVSYPTIKNRLNKIGAALPFVEPIQPPTQTARPDTDALLTGLEKGEITVDEVVHALERNTRKNEEGAP